MPPSFEPSRPIQPDVVFARFYTLGAEPADQRIGPNANPPHLLGRWSSVFGLSNSGDCSRGRRCILGWLLQGRSLHGRSAATT
jgi:hypothetical protein